MSTPPGFSIALPADLASLATRMGVKTASRLSVKLRIQYRGVLEEWIHTTRRTGTLSVFYSQGTPGACGWEESQR